MNRYYVELLANGLVFIRDRHSGLTGTYHENGQYRYGDLMLGIGFVLGLIGQVYASCR